MNRIEFVIEKLNNI